MTFALHHHQECTANSFYLMLITLNLVPSRTDPFRREEKEAHLGRPSDKNPHWLPFSDVNRWEDPNAGADLGPGVLGGRILKPGLKERKSLTPSGNTTQRGRVKALPSVLTRKGDQSVQAFSGRGRHQGLLFSVLDLNFDMVITDLSSKLLKLENPIIKRAAGRELSLLDISEPTRRS